MEPTNHYCEVLGIDVPDLDQVWDHREASPYSRLIVALLERGEPMTLDQVAARFEELGRVSAADALKTLKRCRPGRPPIHRTDDLYALDPHDHEADMWAFRLGLRPPRVPPPEPAPPTPSAPPPSLDEPLTPSLLEEAWTHGIPGAWPILTVAICVLDAHGGSMPAEAACAFAVEAGEDHRLRKEAPRHWRAPCPIEVRDGGATWALVPGHPRIRTAREAAIKRLDQVRRWGPSSTAADFSDRLDRERARRAEESAALRRAVLHVDSASAPTAATLIDVQDATARTWFADDFDELRDRIDDYDVIAGLDVHATIPRLGLEPSTRRRLHELGPPQKSIRIDDGLPVIKLTPDLLIRSSCQIPRPFRLARDAKARPPAKPGRRLASALEHDAFSVLALYHFVLLHGAMRLLWRQWETWLPVTWIHWLDPGINGMQEQAAAAGLPLEAVVGRVLDWSDPWAGAQRVWVRGTIQARTPRLLFDDARRLVEPGEVQLARIAPKERAFRVL